MRYSTASTVAFAAAAIASPLAAPQSPSTPAPAGCSPNYDGKFQIQVVNSTTSAKRSVEKRQDGKLEITLANGVLTDAQGRIGNIVANNQFQFDPAPGQAGAIYTSGWSVCQNGSLAIGGDAQFYQCLSGTFYNLYDEATAAQCYPVFINVIDGAQSSQASTASGLASTLADGQVTGTNVATAPVSQISDGQVQGGDFGRSGEPDLRWAIAKWFSSYSDLGWTSTAAPAYTSAATPTTTSSIVSPISQISDGQIQAPTGNSTVQPTGSNVISAPTGTGSPIAYDGAASSIHATGLGLFAVLAMAFAL